MPIDRWINPTAESRVNQQEALPDEISDTIDLVELFKKAELLTHIAQNGNNRVTKC